MVTLQDMVQALDSNSKYYCVKNQPKLKFYESTSNIPWHAFSKMGLFGSS